MASVSALDALPSEPASFPARRKAANLNCPKEAGHGGMGPSKVLSSLSVPPCRNVLLRRRRAGEATAPSAAAHLSPTLQGLCLVHNFPCDGCGRRSMLLCICMYVQAQIVPRFDACQSHPVLRCRRPVGCPITSALCVVVLRVSAIWTLEGTEYLSDTPKAFGLQRTQRVRWSP